MPGGRLFLQISTGVVALAAVGLLWRDWLASSADPTFAEDPALWAGASGATMGPEGPIPVPGITGEASTGLDDETVRDLVGLPYRDAVSRLGRPPERIAGAATSKPVAVWFAAVRLRQPALGEAQAAHLRLDCSALASAPIESATVRQVVLLGTFGKTIATFPVRGGTP